MEDGENLDVSEFVKCLSGYYSHQDLYFASCVFILAPSRHSPRYHGRACITGKFFFFQSGFYSTVQVQCFQCDIMLAIPSDQRRFTSLARCLLVTNMCL